MKKKAYILPALHMVEVRCETLIAESFQKFTGDGGAQLTKESEADWADIWSE
ncbi:MAG: hypothetical protein IJ700_05740 [Bacteroidaceae bacterium]|nr:hypothetical protein [Bacteroidaceae bacterium]